MVYEERNAWAGLIVGVLVIGGYVVFVLQQAAWIANTMFAGFAVAAMVGSVARVVAYRRGLV